MKEDVKNGSVWIAHGAWSILVALVVGAYNIVTSDTVKNGLRTIGRTTWTAICTVSQFTLRKAGEWFPRVRKVIVTGVIGGWKYFKNSFNNNGASMIQNARKPLRPVGYVLVIASIGIMFLDPIVGVSGFLATVVVFFKDSEELPLSVFGTDAAVSSALGIGTAVMVNLLRLGGAARSTTTWLRSQF